MDVASVVGGLGGGGVGGFVVVAFRKLQTSQTVILNVKTIIVDT